MNTKTNQTERIEQPTLSAVEGLVHDVNSKCGSLKSAAGLLRAAEPAQAQELLGLMAEQAESLAKTITLYKNHLSAKASRLPEQPKL